MLKRSEEWLYYLIIGTAVVCNWILTEKLHVNSALLSKMCTPCRISKFFSFICISIRMQLLEKKLTELLRKLYCHLKTWKNGTKLILTERKSQNKRKTWQLNHDLDHYKFKSQEAKITEYMSIWRLLATILKFKNGRVSRVRHNNSKRSLVKS